MEENQNENNPNKIKINFNNADLPLKDFDNVKEISAIDNFYQEKETENIKTDLGGDFSEGVRLPWESNSQKNSQKLPEEKEAESNAEIIKELEIRTIARIVLNPPHVIMSRG